MTVPTILESSVYGLWIAAQKDRDTAATLAVKQLIQTGGDIDNNRDDGSDNYSDLSRFGTQVDFVNTLVGTGSPVIVAQANEAAYLCWLFFGSEVFTAKVPATSPPSYVFTPGDTTGYWSTIWKRVGLSAVLRQKFNKCKFTSLRIEGSTAAKLVRITPAVVSLDPGEAFVTDPVAVFGTGEPFVYTEGEGTFKIDGDVYRGHSQFAIVCNDGGAPLYGDSVSPYDVGPGNAEITLDGITVVLDSDELKRFNTQIYGKDTPLATDKPLKTVPSYGSYEVTLTKPDPAAVPDLAKKESLKIEIPGVKWSPAVATAPDPDGKVIEHALAGTMRKVAGQPEIRITIETGAGDNLAHALPA
jgi:hypothetical protein